MKLQYFPGDPERQKHAVEQWSLQSQREGASTAGAIRVAHDLLKRKETRIAGGILLFFALLGCTRPASSGVIPIAEASDTPGPSDTPTRTAEPTGIDTATAAWTATHGSVATEPLVVPPSDSPTEGAPALPDADGDGLPDFPDIDPNNNGVDANEMVAGVKAMGEWFNASIRTLVDGKGVPMAEKLMHQFGFDSPQSLSAEAAAAAGRPLIDLPWISDADLREPNSTDAAAHLATRDGLGVLTTGEHFAETMQRLSVQIQLAGMFRDDPDSAVRTWQDIESGMTNLLDLEGKWREGVQPDRVDEMGKSGNLCLSVSLEGSGGLDHPEAKIPVVVDANIQLGGEKLVGNILHVSPKSSIAVVLQLPSTDEAQRIQQLLEQHREFADTMSISPHSSAILQVFLAENSEPLSGGQFVWCGRAEQGDAQPAATSAPSATASATEAQRPSGGQPPATEVPRPQDTHIPRTNTPVVPSATPRPTDALPPTNTPVGPTEAPPSTATHTSEPPPTAPATLTSEVPPTPNATSTTPPQETPPITPPPTSTDMEVTTTPIVPLAHPDSSSQSAQERGVWDWLLSLFGSGS